MGFEITNGVLKKYFRDDDATDIILPEGVVSIGDDAFRDAENLSSITIPEGVTNIGDRAFLSCTNLSSITIPEGMESIGGAAFGECTHLSSIVIPESVKEIWNYAFFGCSRLSRITIPKGVPLPWHLGECKILLIISKTNKRKQDKRELWFYALTSKAESDSYSDYVKKSKWQRYDFELINDGPEYKYRLPARLFGGLDRLLHPVDLTEQNKELYLELLKKNVKKMIPIAEEIRYPAAITALWKLGIIDESNIKAVHKLLLASSVPEIRALAETICVKNGVSGVKHKPAKKETKVGKTSQSPLAKEYWEKFESINGADIIKKMKLRGMNVPKVRLKDGSEAPEEILLFMLASYGKNEDITAFDREADAAAELLSYDSLCEAISEVSNGLDLNGYPAVIPLLCRFGNREQIRNIS